MTISMSKVQTIRQLKREGETIAGISRNVGVSRDTVYKYLEMDDFSPEMPTGKPAESIMDGYRPVIEGYLDDDARSWRKQRHTAKRIYERLRDEHGCTASESTVRHCVARVHKEREPLASSFLTLVWAAGEAQADFGEADLYLMGVRTRLFYLIVMFPFSNVGIAQVFRGHEKGNVENKVGYIRRNLFVPMPNSLNPTKLGLLPRKRHHERNRRHIAQGIHNQVGRIEMAEGNSRLMALVEE